MTAEILDFGKLGCQLEQQEIESPGGVATPQVYGQLLAVYLLQKDLTNAKFVWKRIPQAIKSSNPELAQIWSVGQAMWQRDFPAIYEALHKDWSEAVKPFMVAIEEATRKRAVHLVGQAYSSISGEDLAAFLGMPVNEAVDMVVAEGWKADAQTRIILPNKPQNKPNQGPGIPSEQQLSRLTDFVCFLEN